MRKEFTIAVIGLGLIGGSILKGLRYKKFHLIGISRSEETLNKAVELNLVDECSTNIDIIKEAKIVFICTPMNKIISIIDEVKKWVYPDCIITDVGGLKGFILDYVNNYHVPINFIGGHPMAGSENKGIEQSSENLFEEAKWVLTPSKWTNIEYMQELEGLIHYLGAKPIFADSYEHDKAVTLISHMPLILSQSLFGFLDSYPDENIKELALKLAASGFRDTTRLAATNPELAKDMLLKNKINIRDEIKKLKDYLIQLDENLDLEEEKFIDLIKNLAFKRKNMYSINGRNIY
ncbi:MAG: prephenate dehydrogenase/arogenate dehydrogenase family protein [bacterium]